MLRYEFRKYIHKSYFKIIAVWIVLVLIGLYSLKNVKLILELSKLIDSSDKITMNDYILGVFNSFQFVMTFIFPILFSILVSDLIISDYREAHINMIFTRVNSIFIYVIKKCIFICILAVAFTLSLILILLGIAFFMDLSFSGKSNHYVYLYFNFINKSYTYIYLHTIAMFLIGLIFIGLLTILISVYTKNSAISVGLIVLIGYVHNVFYILSSKWISVLPFSQYIVGVHKELYPFGIPLSYFTQKFSITYMLVGSIFIVILILRKLKKLQGVIK
ncbi:hypothetical protein LEQ06_16585 [Paraclostridium sp. AKS46]|nr:hypothetical protein [Paraclostridium sp. AKS46]